MNYKTKIFAFALTLFIFFISQSGVALAGFGISPPTVANKNLVPGSFYEQNIYLIQGTPDQDLNATVAVDAGAINSWITIENGNSFNIPKGTQQFAMKVDVNVPPTAALGNYKGKIHINTLPATKNPGGVQVTLGAEVAINLDVTDIKVSDFSIRNFQIPDVAKGAPIKFIIKVKNEGNVENGPTKVSLTFFDQYHSKQLGQQDEDITEKVQSFQTKDISVDFPNNLDLGSYWADVKIYSGNKVAVDSKMVFNVVSPSVIAKNKQKGFVFPMPNFSAIPPWVYMLIGAVIVIIVLIIIIIIILRKNKNNGGGKPREEKEEVKKLRIHGGK